MHQLCWTALTYNGRNEDTTKLYILGFRDQYLSFCGISWCLRHLANFACPAACLPLHCQTGQVCSCCAPAKDQFQGTWLSMHAVDIQWHHTMHFTQAASLIWRCNHT